MRLLVCGDRNWDDAQLVEDIIAKLEPSVVIEGEARGADTMARLAAIKLGIKVLGFPAQWATYGRAAGPVRNRQMVKEGRPDIILAFHNNISASKGTKDMLAVGVRAGIDCRLCSCERTAEQVKVSITKWG